MPGNILDLKAGSVLHIIDFKYPNYGNEVKPVWMVYLGRDDINACDLFLHLHRFTSQTQHYCAGGPRDASLAIPFTCNQYGIFTEACVLDFNEPGYHLPHGRITEHKYEVFGPLPEDVIRRMWNVMNKSRHYSKIQLKTIRASLSNSGISGLK
jgi:hypothetical protein